MRRPIGKKKFNPKSREVSAGVSPQHGMADLNALVIFAVVVESRSFSAAARRLAIPVSTISRRIAEFENELGVQLLERSTRQLRLTEVGTEVLEQAQRGVELSETVNNIVSYKRSNLSGTLRVATPPNLSDCLLAPVINAFQAEHPSVKVHVYVTDRIIDQTIEGVMADGIDVGFKVGPLKDSSLIARTVLTYRHQLVASPKYLLKHPPPEVPLDLLGHSLLGFSFRSRINKWHFIGPKGREETITFTPHLAMNDFAGLAQALVAGVGIGDLPPIIQPELLRSGKLVEVMPKFRFRNFDLSLIHKSGRHIPRAIRVFEEFAMRIIRDLFPSLPA